jgi:uncharacterized protein YrrD
MKLSDLRGRAVVDVNDSKKLGELADIVIDPATRKPVGIKVKSGLFSQAQVVPIEHLKSVGPDAVTVTGQGPQSNPQGGDPAAPDTAVPPLQEPLDASTIHGHKVITDSGTLVGEVQDIVLDPATLAITGYEVRPGGLFARAQEIPVTSEVRHGQDLITVPSSLLS